MSQKRNIVIGGAGFLGSHLIDLLLDKTQDEIVCIDNFCMGQRENIAEALKNPRFSVHEIDITDRDALLRACEGADRIAHLAAFKIPRYGNRLKTLEVNGLGTLNVLEAARRQNARLIFTSTSDVYGMSPDLPFQESGNITLGTSTSARWAYAASKLYDEQLILGYQEEYNLPITIIRVFGSYGPRHHLSWWGGPQSVFISAMLQDQEIEIHGTGEQTRSFCYVGDTVSGLYKAWTSDRSLGEIINIGNDHEISIFNLAQKIHDLMKKSGDLKYKKIPLKNFSRDYQDVRRRVPDLSKAETLLNWKPEVDLDQGLLQTIDWQKQVMNT